MKDRSHSGWWEFPGQGLTQTLQLGREVVATSVYFSNLYLPPSLAFAACLRSCFGFFCPFSGSCSPPNPSVP